MVKENFFRLTFFTTNGEHLSLASQNPYFIIAYSLAS